jgi:GNAT superfamily N-acetyltransferase
MTQMSVISSTNKAQNEGAARILAATLTLIARERRTMAPPYCLWDPDLSAKEIKDLALEVANGKALVIWVDNYHPARGLIILRERELESELLGYGSFMLKGPFLVDPDPKSRQKTTSLLVKKAIIIAGGYKAGFLSAKTTHDPAVLRGFLEEGFSMAEIDSCLIGPIPEEKDLENLTRISGIELREAEIKDAELMAEELGDLFYDGHHLHGPYLPMRFAGELWKRILIREIKLEKPALKAVDIRKKRTVGLALGDINGTDASLSILHVNEERRKEGLGRLLLKSLMRLLRNKGANSLYVETASFNIPALNLYASLGLKPVAPKVALHLRLGEPKGKPQEAS